VPRRYRRDPGRTWPHRLAILIIIILAIDVVAAPSWSEQQPPPEPAGTRPEATPPGGLRLGPLFVSPRLRIGTIGLDTNVFYSATDRQTDLTASGGPGLQLLLPVRQSTRLVIDGSLDYLFFLRTESQRRLTGAARATFEWNGPRTRFVVEESFQRSYRRPSFEVDQRVLSDTEATRAELKHRLFDRISLLLAAARSRDDAGEGQLYLGTDLGRTTTRRTRLGRAGVDYALTIKTSLVVEGERQDDAFPLDAARDTDSKRLVAGLRTDATALISGRALAGVRWLRPRRHDGGERRVWVADVDAALNLSPKTRIGGSYLRDIGYTAFTPVSGLPTLGTESLGARIEKDLIARLDLRLFGRLTRLVTHQAVALELPGGERVVAVRDDEAREAGADLGYRFRSKLRIGVAAIYTERRSTISNFGIDGLLVGATVTYSPD
jgi:hypothetical protein